MHNILYYLQIVLTYVLTLYLLVLIGTLIVSWIQAFARDWRPRGVVLVVAESLLTLTDPPLKFLRRHIPAFQLGMVRLDLSFMVLFIVVLILLRVAVPLL